jgi:hypothetical protein
MTRTITRWANPIRRLGALLNWVHSSRFLRKTCCGVQACSMERAFSM